MNNIWKNVGSIGLEILKEIGEIAEESSRMEKQNREKEAKLEEEAAQLRKELLEQKSQNKLSMIYSLENLKKMSTSELKSEVYSIYQENKSIFRNTSEELERGTEARNLYFESVYSESRYRAKLIKFLFEKGNI